MFAVECLCSDLKIPIEGEGILEVRIFRRW